MEICVCFYFGFVFIKKDKHNIEFEKKLLTNDTTPVQLEAIVFGLIVISIVFTKVFVDLFKT